jgi:tRNA(adenine34) deaminase
MNDNQRVSEHDAFMGDALEQARLARDAGEVPIGAVLVMGGQVVGRGFNRPISGVDPTAHAELVAIRDAATRLGNYRLIGSTLYVTIEPCLMCAGAFVHARIGTVVYGALEPRTGALASTVRAAELPGHNHRVAVVGGIRSDECRALMQEFFRQRRVAKPDVVAAPGDGKEAIGDGPGDAAIERPRS